MPLVGTEMGLRTEKARNTISSKSLENLHTKKCQKVLWMLQEKIREHGLQ